MILGVDHLSLSCERIDLAIDSLKAKGFQLAFKEADLANAEEKRNFLRTWSQKHAIALLKSREGVGIELTEHASALNPAHASTLSYDLEACAHIRTPHFEQELEFWTKGLNFYSTARCKEPCSVDLRSSSHVKSLQLNLKIHEDTRLGHAPLYLDDEGYNCIALYTNDLAKDLPRLVSHGGLDLSAPFSLEVNGKPLRLALLRSPAGVCVELIQRVFTRN